MLSAADSLPLPPCEVHDAFLHMQGKRRKQLTPVVFSACRVLDPDFAEADIESVRAHILLEQGHGKNLQDSA